MKKTVILILASLLFSGTAFALEEVSYRLQALGGDFKGTVKDEYTDIFINPARIETSSREITGTSLTPLNFGYFTSNHFAVLAGISGSTRKDQTVYTYSTSTYLEEINNSNNYLNESVSAAFIKGFKSGSSYFGVAIIPQRDYSDASVPSSDIYSGRDTQNIINFFTSTNSNTQQTSDVVSVRLNLGLFKIDDESNEREFVLSAKYQNINTLNDSVYHYFRNDDPDGNGLDRNNVTISTPSYLTANETVNYSYPAVSLAGFGIKYRSSSKTSYSGRKSFYLEASWMPGRNDGSYIDQTQNTTTSGTTITNQNSVYSSYTFTNRSDTYSLITGLARTLNIDKFMFAIGAHSNLAYVKSSSGYQPSIQGPGDQEQFNYTLSLPLGFEYNPIPSVFIRGGASPSVSGSVAKNTRFPNSVTTNKSYSDSFSEGITNSLGFGIVPFKSLVIDVLSSSANTHFQVTYLF
jgi:hypothetical protein